MTLLSIVVCTRGESERHLTTNLLDSIAKSDAPKEYEFIEMSSGGLAEARRAGMDKATGDFILLTDNDMTVPNEWWKAFETTFASDLRIVMAVPFLRCKRLVKFGIKLSTPIPPNGEFTLYPSLLQQNSDGSVTPHLITPHDGFVVYRGEYYRQTHLPPETNWGTESQPLTFDWLYLPLTRGFRIVMVGVEVHHDLNASSPFLQNILRLAGIPNAA